MKIMMHECRNIHEQRIFRLPQNVSPRIMMNVGNPETAFSFGQLPNEGIGLARLEFVSWTQHLAMVGRDQPLLGSEKTKVRKLKFEASKLTIHGRLPCNISNYNIFTRHSKKLASLLLVIWRCTKYSLSLSMIFDIQLYHQYVQISRWSAYGTWRFLSWTTNIALRSSTMPSAFTPRPPVRCGQLWGCWFLADGDWWDVRWQWQTFKLISR